MGTSERTIIACTACGTVHDHATSLVANLREEITLRDRELGVKSAQLAKARGEQAKSLTAHPRYRDALDVLETWKVLVKPTARELTGSARLKPTLARLGEFSVEDLKKCVLGYSRFPYVVDAQRVAQGPKSCWYAEVDTIFATAKRVEKGIELAEQAVSVVATVPNSMLSTVSWRTVWLANRKLIVSALTKEFGQGLEADGGIRQWPCPQCHARPGAPMASCRVNVAPGSWLVTCHFCGLTEDQLLRHVADPSSFDDSDVLPLDIGLAA